MRLSVQVKQDRKKKAREDTSDFFCLLSLCSVFHTVQYLFQVQRRKKKKKAAMELLRKKKSSSQLHAPIHLTKKFREFALPTNFSVLNVLHTVWYSTVPGTYICLTIYHTVYRYCVYSYSTVHKHIWSWPVRGVVR